MSFGIHLSQAGHCRASSGLHSAPTLPVWVQPRARHSRGRGSPPAPKRAPTGARKGSRSSWDLQPWSCVCSDPRAAPSALGGPHSRWEFSSNSCKDGSTSAGRFAPKALQGKGIPCLLEFPGKHRWRFGVSISCERLLQGGVGQSLDSMSWEVFSKRNDSVENPPFTPTPGLEQIQSLWVCFGRVGLQQLWLCRASVVGRIQPSSWRKPNDSWQHRQEPGLGSV